MAQSTNTTLYSYTDHAGNEVVIDMITRYKIQEFCRQFNVEKLKSLRNNCYMHRLFNSLQLISSIIVTNLSMKVDVDYLCHDYKISYDSHNCLTYI